MDHVKEGKHGARSAKQAIAIGLSKARRAGVKLKPPKAGTASERTRKQAARDVKKGQSGTARKPSAKRSRASTAALKREGRAWRIGVGSCLPTGPVTGFTGNQYACARKPSTTSF